MHVNALTDWQKASTICEKVSVVTSSSLISFLNELDSAFIGTSWRVSSKPSCSPVSGVAVSRQVQRRSRHLSRVISAHGNRRFGRRSRSCFFIAHVVQKWIVLLYCEDAPVKLLLRCFTLSSFAGFGSFLIFFICHQVRRMMWGSCRGLFKSSNEACQTFCGKHFN